MDRTTDKDSIQIYSQISESIYLNREIFKREVISIGIENGREKKKEREEINRDN